jgi:hypothetical protein
MTAAEKLREQGREQGIELGIKKVAINFLKDGIAPRIFARNTGIELAAILRLKAQLKEV